MAFPRKNPKYWYGIALLVAANSVVLAGIFLARPSVNFAKLYFFEVGQGDAIYIRTAQGNDILIDGGPGDAVLEKLGRAMPFFDRTVELVILTHPHADHISGLVEVLKRYKVKKFMLSEVNHDSKIFEELLKRLDLEKAQVIRPRLGQRVFLDRSTVFDVYYPISEFENTPKDLNDVSIVGKLSFGKMNIFLTGDAGKDIEKQLLAWRLPISSEILKIGHHGSRHSTNREFLETVSPQYSIISVGKNPYGHPHEEVLGVLTSATTEILRTDQSGDLEFRLYPDHVELHK